MWVVSHWLVKVTRWNRFIPIKVNVFIWRLCLNPLPVRGNLYAKGIDVEFVLCPCYEVAMETKVDNVVFDTIPNIFLWVDTFSSLWDRRSMVDSIVCTLLWVIWNYRSTMLFAYSKPKKDMLFDSVISLSLIGFLSQSKDVGDQVSNGPIRVDSESCHFNSYTIANSLKIKDMKLAKVKTSKETNVVHLSLSMSVMEVRSEEPMELRVLCSSEEPMEPWWKRRSSHNGGWNGGGKPSGKKKSIQEGFGDGDDRQSGKEKSWMVLVRLNRTSSGDRSRWVLFS
ncbi:hypothetical protein LXL04_017918 [Taraxacum kok-saghyz]